MSEAPLRDLVARAGAFHITDRAMLKAQKTIEAALATGDPTPAQRAAYLRAAGTYFAGFARDADAQLTGVDRQLDALYQRQYNLAAERGVAQKRVEAVRGVLTSLAELGTE